LTALSRRSLLLGASAVAVGAALPALPALSETIFGWDLAAAGDVTTVGMLDEWGAAMGVCRMVTSSKIDPNYRLDVMSGEHLETDENYARRIRNMILRGNPNDPGDVVVEHVSGEELFEINRYYDRISKIHEGGGP
jgi:hypothetical protein